MATRWETTRDDDGNRVGVALHFTSLISRPRSLIFDPRVVHTSRAFPRPLNVSSVALRSSSA